MSDIPATPANMALILTEIREVRREMRENRSQLEDRIAALERRVWILSVGTGLGGTGIGAAMSQLLGG